MTLREYLDQRDQSQQKLADRLAVSQGLISQWLNWLEGREKNAVKITPEVAARIETQTDGKVRCESLLPNVKFERTNGRVTHYRVPLADRAQAA